MKGLNKRQQFNENMAKASEKWFGSDSHAAKEYRKANRKIEKQRSRGHHSKQK